jgi:hypothetical protein
MRDYALRALLAILIVVPGGMAVAQARPQQKTLVLNGRSGEASVIQIDNRLFVELEGLARIGNGSVSFQGNAITLTLPPSVSASHQAEAEPVPAHSGLSQEFMKAGIETIAQMREWASTLAYAIQNGYGVTEGWVANYREQAANSLRLATAAASTDSDRSALQLISNEFDAVREWSNKLVEAKKSMNVGKYAVSPDALRDEPLSQKIIACGHFLAPMLASGSFHDDASCH